jgi:hypothetical protein
MLQISNTTRLLCGVMLITVPTIEFGGVFLRRHHRCALGRRVRVAPSACRPAGPARHPDSRRNQLSQTGLEGGEPAPSIARQPFIGRPDAHARGVGGDRRPPLMHTDALDEQGTHMRSGLSRYDGASLGASSRIERNVW